MSDLSITLKVSMREYNLLRSGLDSATNELHHQLKETKNVSPTDGAPLRRKINEKIAEFEVLKGRLDA